MQAMLKKILNLLRKLYEVASQDVGLQILSNLLGCHQWIINR